MVITHKRGDTFGALGTLRDSAKVAQDLTGVTIACTLKDRDGAVVDALDVTVLTQSGATLGQYQLARTFAQTALWPIGALRGDIQYTFPDATRKSTETFTVNVVEDITPP